MNLVLTIAHRLQNLLDACRKADFLAPLAFRLYLAPIFIAVGLHKALHFDDIVQWFEFGLELPMPRLMALLATAAELGGGIALIFGFATRWVVVPMMVTMIVAAGTAHWDNGWFAIAPSDPDTSIASLFAPLGFPGADASLANSTEVALRLQRARDLLSEYGNYDWLTETGNFVILNNGIEFAFTYFILLFSLFFTGGGRYVSLDFWLARQFGRNP